MSRGVLAIKGQPPNVGLLNFIRAIGRPDLLSLYSNPELPDLVTRDVPPVSADVRRQLRHDVTAHLADLRRRIETAS